MAAQMQEIESSKDTEVLNILMLGETGVGKSTFINAFVNYTAYDSLTTAKNEALECLIPSKFTITDENYKQRIIQIGADDNENTADTANSQTQAAKAYKFDIESEEECFSVRFIDTPGIGDTRGIEQDKQNFENVLSYISQYDELHAICILLKPNNARITAQFEFCLNTLFCQLEKSASQNLIFVFTNTRSTFYRPGDTLPALAKLLENVAQKPPYVRIQTEKTNMYCFDNEAFRFLAAVKDGVPFSEEEVENFACSWEQSSKECWRMLDYIRGKEEIRLVPHKVQDTISVNDARNFIFNLSRPLADITQLISDNISLMERHKVELSKEGMSLVELKAKLYIPNTDVRLKKLSNPVTVCAAPKCVKSYTVNGRTAIHYRQRCHNPCQLSGVPKEIIGSPELVNCAAMNGTENCTQCFCSFSVHMHIRYETELFENNIVDVNVVETITTKDKAVAYSQTLIETLSTKIKLFEDEKSFVIKSLAKFSHFLANNAITPFNDAYKQYFQYLIERERAHGDNYDPEAVKNLETLLARYNEERNILNMALNERLNAGITEQVVVTADDIKTTANSLYELPNFGQSIKDALDIQLRAQALEFKNDEYKHRIILHRQNIGRILRRYHYSGNTIFICGLPVYAKKCDIAWLFKGVCDITQESTKVLKITIFTNVQQGKNTVEAAVTFPTKESANLAVQRVNGIECRPGFKLSVYLIEGRTLSTPENTSLQQYAKLANEKVTNALHTIRDKAYSAVVKTGLIDQRATQTAVCIRESDCNESSEVSVQENKMVDVVKNFFFLWKKN